MTEALWRKRGNSLVPADAATEKRLATFREGWFVATTAPAKPRNPKHHRLMMAVLTKVVEHCWPRFADIGELSDWLKLKSGMVREVYVVDGVVKLEFKSISFHAMDETEFRALREKWMQIICTELMPGTDPEALMSKEWR